MERESRIVNLFVEVADAMVDRLDPLDFLHTLCRRCVELLDCDEAGVLILDAEGRLQVMGSSSERTESLELLQTHGTEGPCRECLRTGRPIMCEDLERERDRWPTFAPAAVARGFRAVRSSPMQVHGEPVGTLNLFRMRPGAFAARDADLTRGIADMAAVALLQDRALRESESMTARLQGALSSRVVIEQAKGMLAERRGGGVDEAFERIRRFARSRNLRLHEVAEQLVAGELSPDDLEDPLPA